MDCELVGDAAACALALGEASTLAEAARLTRAIRRRFEPVASIDYAEAFTAYQEALAALESVDRAASSRRSIGSGNRR